MFWSRAKSVIGLDITTSSIKLIELTQSGRSYRVECHSAEPSPPNSINEKTIVDAEAVGEAVRRAIKRAATNTEDVAIAINGDAAITKVIQMPSNLGDNELESQVEIQVDQYIPFPMEEVSYDFQVMGENANDPDMMDVLLVATRTENVDQRRAAVESAGLKARVVDVEAFALERGLCRKVPRVTGRTEPLKRKAIKRFDRIFNDEAPGFFSAPVMEHEIQLVIVGHKAS